MVDHGWLCTFIIFKNSSVLLISSSLVYLLFLLMHLSLSFSLSLIHFSLSPYTFLSLSLIHFFFSLSYTFLSYTFLSYTFLSLSLSLSLIHLPLPFSPSLSLSLTNLFLSGQVVGLPRRTVHDYSRLLDSTDPDTSLAGYLSLVGQRAVSLVKVQKPILKARLTRSLNKI